MFQTLVYMKNKSIKLLELNLDLIHKLDKD